MPRTYEPIASQTLGSDTSSITFSSIAALWTDLRLVCVGRSVWSSDGFDALILRFNGDSASNYSYTYLGTFSGSPTSGRSSNQTNVSVTRVNPSTSGNTNPSISAIDIFSYANTSVFKTLLGAGAADAEAIQVIRSVGLWRSTSAISSITISGAQGTGALRSGFTASLYGIKAA
jgi:hypothetical protein